MGSEEKGPVYSERDTEEQESPSTQTVARLTQEKAATSTKYQLNGRYCEPFSWRQKHFLSPFPYLQNSGFYGGGVIVGVRLSEWVYYSEGVIRKAVRLKPSRQTDRQTGRQAGRHPQPT